MSHSTFKTGGGWGNHISWLTVHEQVYGHLPFDFPEPGDLLESDMKSGRVGVYVFTEVRREDNPEDMFFGEVMPLGYKDELDLNRNAKEQ